TTLGAYAYDMKGNQVIGPHRNVSYGRNDLPVRIVHKPTAPSGETTDFIYDGQASRVRTVNHRTRVTVDTLRGYYTFRRPSGKHGPNGEHSFTITVEGRPVPLRVCLFSQNALVQDAVQYLHADHQESIDLISGVKGKILERLTYEPFGRR